MAYTPFVHAPDTMHSPVRVSRPLLQGSVSDGAAVDLGKVTDSSTSPITGRLRNRRGKEPSLSSDAMSAARLLTHHRADHRTPDRAARRTRLRQQGRAESRRALIQVFRRDK